MVAALALSAVLAFTALVINVGFFLSERRGLQNAADAAALAAAWQVLQEQTSGSLRDSVAYQAAVSFALQNGADVGGTRQIQVTYVDAGGASLGAAGGGGPIPAAAAGVRVGLTGPFTTILGSFLGGSVIQSSAQAQARTARVAFPGSATHVLPIALPLASFQNGASVDLYDQQVASSAYGVGNYLPFLDLASAANSGAGYLPGPVYGDAHTNLQYWSDGSHDSGQLGIGTRIVLAGSGFATDVRTGLLDNVRRQGLTDASGVRYMLATVPLWDTYLPSGGTGQPDIVQIIGFASVRITMANVGAASIQGWFVPYVLDPPSHTQVAGPSWGPSAIRLVE
ncbi:MAG: hypothetical protein QOF51_948 [Chloroflexota bacterium]|nr:hypothetical protein [Chloroflexota bacterium]